MIDNKGIYHNQISKAILFRRLVWKLASCVLFKPFPTRLFWRWNRVILKLFGAKLGRMSVVHSNCSILCPWNLDLKENACIGPHCIIENDDMITMGINATVSQYSYLCTSSHDIYHKEHTLIYAPIIIGDKVWVGAGSFIGKGVVIKEGAVVAAKSVVVKDVNAWEIHGGNPANFIKKRIILN